MKERIEKVMGDILSRKYNTLIKLKFVPKEELKHVSSDKTRIVEEQQILDK